MAKAKKDAQQQFTVRGRGEFPIDMLRYDRATPATEQDSGVIIRSFRNLRIGDSGPHEVRVSAPRMTYARWQSFGWTVDDAPGTTSIRRSA